MKSNIMLIGALFALISFVAADVSELNQPQQPAPAAEETIKRIHVLNPGEKEYLSPNLIGVQNIAITNIPVTMNFINIIDAYREVVDGVRYEIVLNAVNTTDKNSEVICRLVVLEKPWLTTLWGDKVRQLQESNCTNEIIPDTSRDRKALEEKYETNAIFSGSRNELTTDDMLNLESQILSSSSSNPQMTRQRAANALPTTTTTTTPVYSESEPYVVTEQTNPTVQPEAVSGGVVGDATESIVSSSQDDTTTTTEKIPELNDNEKKWLDDFLSIGAYNFETSIDRKNAQNGNNEAQLNGQDSDKRNRRSIPGGANELNAEELKEQVESLTKSLAKIASGESPAPFSSVDHCDHGTTQVVAGSLVKLNCVLVNSKTGKKDNCKVTIVTQVWLPNGHEITFDCKDTPKSTHRHSRSVENKNKRQILGGANEMSAEQLKEQVGNLKASMAKLAAGDSKPDLELISCDSGTSQVVAGSLVKMNCQMMNTKTGKIDSCVVSLFTQLWQAVYEVDFECRDTPKSTHRHSRSVGGNDKRSKRGLRGAPKQLTDFELKEQEGRVSQSLVKIASGDGPSYSISRAFNGTKQTVAGSLVKIYAELIDGSTGGKENCTVTLWARPWIPIDGSEVTFECKDKHKSVHRHSRSVEYEQKKTHKKSHRSLDKAEHLFQKFQIQFKKNYHNSMERQMRLRIFKHNLRLIHDLNKNEMGSAKYGITEFADMTTTEYRERTGLLSREESNAVRTPAKIPDVELPKEFDWREKGVVSKVKNQGSCGSCWAFSVTGNIEGLHAVKTGKLEEYSEQELLDCDTTDSACNGGLPDDAYKAIEKLGGLELESEYPYEARKGKCNFNSSRVHVKLSGAVDLPKNETAMAQWLIANGPISIGINANAMQFYRGGVSHPWKALCSKKSLDHGVLIVGYGVSEYPMFKKILPYWIVKNSWGPKWGEQGYYRIYRGDNSCGVSEMASSAVLAS